ncbi:hypothetical protein L9F63_011953, partial [Diploptera punctata]
LLCFSFIAMSSHSLHVSVLGGLKSLILCLTFRLHTSHTSSELRDLGVCLPRESTLADVITRTSSFPWLLVSAGECYVTSIKHIFKISMHISNNHFHVTLAALLGNVSDRSWVDRPLAMYKLALRENNNCHSPPPITEGKLTLLAAPAYEPKRSLSSKLICSIFKIFARKYNYNL